MEPANGPSGRPGEGPGREEQASGGSGRRRPGSAGVESGEESPEGGVGAGGRDDEQRMCGEEGEIYMDRPLMRGAYLQDAPRITEYARRISPGCASYN